MTKEEFNRQLRELLDSSEQADERNLKILELQENLYDFISAAKVLRYHRVKAVTNGTKPEFWSAVQSVIDLIPEGWR